MRSVTQVVREALIKEIEYLRNFCKPEQLSSFDNQHRSYGGLRNLPEEKLRETLVSFQSTVNQNFRKP